MEETLKQQALEKEEDPFLHGYWEQHANSYTHNTRKWLQLQNGEMATQRNMKIIRPPAEQQQARNASSTRISWDAGNPARESAGTVKTPREATQYDGIVCRKGGP